MRSVSPPAGRVVIRVIAATSLLTLPAVFASRFTVEKLSWLLGFRQPPDAPLLFYLGAGGSFVYIALSALLWIMAADVPRYRPLIRFVAMVAIAGAPIYWWMNFHAGMPLWWAMMDVIGCLAGGLALLWAAGSDEAPPDQALVTAPAPSAN